MAKKWIQKAIKHPGALHRELGIPAHQVIPHDKLVEAAKSNNKVESQRARLAITLERMHKQ